jgi:phosphate transport system substrate-binding protein
MMRSNFRRSVAAVLATSMLVVSMAPALASAATLKISGSTTVYPLAAKWASVYKSKYGGSITVVGGGSGKGISDAKAGIVNIGMSSRKQSASDGAVYFTPVARDALVIAVSAKLRNAYPNYIYKMNQATVQKIFRGQITNWRQVNSHLPNHAINLVGRTGSSGTYTYFKQMFLTNESATGQIGSVMYKQSPRTRTYASNGIVRSAVANDMYAIGYLSEAYVNSTVKPLNLPTPKYYYDENYTLHSTPSSAVGHYVVPNATNAANGTYKYVRPLYFVTAGTSAPTGDTKTFIEWCRSKTAGKGQSYCAPMHFLKL